MEVLSLIALVWLFFLQGKVWSLESLVSKPKNVLSSSDTSTTPVTPKTRMESTQISPVTQAPFATVQHTEEMVSPTSDITPSRFTEEKTQQQTHLMNNEQQNAHWLGIAGIIALVIGTGFFFKYAIENNWISPVMQITLFAAVGLILIVFGLLPKLKTELLGGLLAGGGYAVLFLTIFAAHTDYYSIITDSFLALILYTVVALSAFIIGIAESMPALLYVSLFGLFIAPYLAGDDIFAILPWYSIIFSGILLTSAYLKRWYGLACIGFIGFAIHFQTWFFIENQEQMLALAFIGITGLLYSLYALAQALRNEEAGGETPILTWLVPLVVLVTGGLQILDSDLHGIFALILAGLYFLYTLTLYAEKKTFDSFTMHHAAIAGLLLVIFIPLQWSDEWLVFGWLFLGTAFTIVGYTSRQAVLEIAGFSTSSLALTHALMSEYLFVTTKEEPLFNTRGAILISVIFLTYIYVYLYTRSIRTNATYVATFLTLAQVASVWFLTTEIAQSYSNKEISIGNPYYNNSSQALSNQKDTAISSVWGTYALTLITIGFVLRQKILRTLGLILFFITAVKIFTLVWTIGGIWKSVAFIAFAALALLSSYLYTRYKDRL